MRFEQPLWLSLTLLALAASAAGWFVAEKKRAALAYPEAATLRGSTAAGSLWVRHAPWVLRTLTLILVAVALARPQKVTRQDSQAQGIDIMLALDTSLSMKALDFNPLDRMSAAKNAARRFIEGRVSDRIGILVFGGAPLLTCPLTTDYEALLEFLDGVYPGMTYSDGTAIGDGIAAAVNHLKDSAAKSKVIILLTDGRSNTGLVDPLTAARAAKIYGIKVYTIGAGARGPSLYPIDDPTYGRRIVQIPEDLDEDLLLQLAAETNGRYFRAASLDQLSSIWREIDRMEKTDVKQPPVVSFADMHPILLWPAVILLAGEMLLSGTLLLKVP